MAQNAPRGGWGIAALLWVAAAGYFLVGIGIGIEGVEEGHLVYLSWRVAEGALPYRDFQHWYGPATFFFNGLLFRLFGPDLLVVRLGLVAARTTLAVEVFLVSRRLAGTVPALLAWALTVAICGMPIWFFVTPYAGNYQLPLALGALTCVLLIDRRPVGAVLAGALLGLAATFKPLGGILPLAGCVLALLARGAPAAATTPPRTPAWRAAALAAVLGVGGILAAIAPSLGGAWNVALLWSPSVAVALWTLVRVWRAPASAAAVNLIDVLWLGLGFAVAPLALVIFYAAHGLVSTMAWAVLLGLPRKFSLAASYPLPTVAAVLCLVFGAASVVIWRAERAGRRLAGARAWVPALLAVAAAAVLPISASLSTGGWLLASGALLLWLPPVAVWLAVAAVMRGRRGDLPAPVRVVAIVSSTLLPLLGPVGDWAHVLIALPVFLPLAAWGLRAVGASGEEVWRPWGYAVGAVGVMITATLVHMLVAAHPPSLITTGAYERASAIQDRRPVAGDARAVVAYVRDHVAPDARIAVMPSEAMLYFLSGRNSALDEDEFAFYAATTGPQLSATDARQLVDEAAAIRRLEQERPIVIQRRGRLVATFREIFPTLGAYLDRAYRPSMAFGPYQILESRAMDAGSRADGAEAEPR